MSSGLPYRAQPGRELAHALQEAGRAPPVHRRFIIRGLDRIDAEGNVEDVMSLRSLAGYSIAALAGAAMFALPLSPASAFTLSGPSLQQPIASAHIDIQAGQHMAHWIHRRDLRGAAEPLQAVVVDQDGQF